MQLHCNNDEASCVNYQLIKYLVCKSNPFNQLDPNQNREQHQRERGDDTEKKGFNVSLWTDTKSKSQSEFWWTSLYYVNLNKKKKVAVMRSANTTITLISFSSSVYTFLLQRNRRYKCVQRNQQKLKTEMPETTSWISSASNLSYYK